LYYELVSIAISSSSFYMMNGQTSWPANLPARQLSFINLGDLLSRWICQAAAWLVILLAILLLVVLLLGSWLSLQTNGLSFFLTDVWKPQEDRRVFGAVAFLYGTLVSSALAMLIAVPLGVGAAAFLAEIASPWLRRIGSFLIEMLATVPS
jgi:ABC-type phosphate transport system permease subunit